MDYEESDLDHSEMPFMCPACGLATYYLISDLEKNPLVRCPHCDCFHTVKIDERKDDLHSFFEKIKKFKNGDV